VGDVISGVSLLYTFLAEVIGPWAPTARRKSFAQTFRGNQAKIRVFRAFGWLSGVSGLKVMAKSKIWAKHQKPDCY